MIKIIRAGSRNFDNYSLLKTKLDYYLRNCQTNEIEIVSGTARGADRLGERYAQEKGFNLKRFPANWSRFGRRAGYLRNEQMIEYATHAIFFWDGKSKGTRHAIALCKQYRLPCKVISFSHHGK